MSDIEKPDMTIEEKASQLAGWLTNPHWMKKHFVEALTEAYARGRRDGLDEALKACTVAWGKAGRRLPNHGDCKNEIRNLIEKEPTT